LSWFINGNHLYIHFAEHDPPLVAQSIKNGILYGFTNKEPVKIGELQYLPDLLDVPEIEQSADPLKYSTMKFISGSVGINNTNGSLDTLTSLFGNDLNILIREGDGLSLLQQFYIAKYKISSKLAMFEVKDKRERLSFSAPDTYYTADEYPFIADKYIDKVILDAYGYCFGVLGVCLNRKQIYEDATYSPFNDWFSFKFARSITQIDTVEVKMSDVWTEVYPGLGIPGNEDYVPVNPHPVQINNANGVITIWWSQAMKPNSGHLYSRNGEANDVRATGHFNLPSKPGDIAKDILTYYGNMPYEAAYFNIEEWEAELGTLPEIGICLDSSKVVYEWIEKIQNGCLIGWQLLVDKNFYTARLDNPNRTESFSIPSQEILNINEIEAEFDGGNYATFTNIQYAYNYAEKLFANIIDKSLRDVIINLYMADKEYKNDSYLRTRELAETKGKIILQDFSEVRPIIRGIRLFGHEWFNIKLYGTGFIDFSMKLPENLKSLQKYMEDRNFLGKLRVQIISKKISAKDEIVTIDVRQRDKLEALNDYV
jgi:hypothetical protein